MDFSYNAFKQGKLKTNKVGTDLSYSTFLANKQKTEQVAIDRDTRIEQGLPTSVFSGSAEPNFVEKIAQGIIRPAADVLLNVENTERVVLGKEKLKVAKNKWLGDIKGLGEIDVTKSPFEKENLKVILNSASTGAEIASYLNAGGVAKSTIAGLTERGVLASKNTFAEWVVKEFPKLAKEGFLQGLAYTAGSQGREYVATGKTPSAKQAVTDVALSTIGSVAIPAVLQKTFGTSSKKILNARETERAIADARILGRPIPEVGVPSAKFMTESGRTLPAPRTPGEIPIELPGKGILKSAEDLRNSVKPVAPEIPKTPLQSRAANSMSKQDFINRERKSINLAEDINKNKVTKGSVAEVPKITDKQLAKIWDDAHTLPTDIPKPTTYSVPTKTKPKDFSYKTFLEEKQTGTPPGTTSTTPTGNTVPDIKQPKVENQILKDVERMADEVEGFEPGKFLEWSTEIRKLDPEEIKNVAMGGKKTVDNNIPANAYLSIAKNLAEESGDIKMVKELASSNVASKTGQGLVASKLTTTGNIVDDLREVVLQKLRNKKLDETKLTQEQNALFKKVKDRLTEFTQTTKQEVDNIISSLICK